MLSLSCQACEGRAIGAGWSEVVAESRMPILRQPIIIRSKPRLISQSYHLFYEAEQSWFTSQRVSDGVRSMFLVPQTLKRMVSCYSVYALMLFSLQLL